MEELNVAQKIAVWLLPVLFAITVHEVAHGWVANKLGDSTARMLGRLTLNPLKHIDPVGTVLVPALTMLRSGFVFGWARPVPVTWQNLRQPKRDMVLVAAAGPAANLLMALAWALVVRIGVHYHAVSWRGRATARIDGSRRHIRQRAACCSSIWFPCHRSMAVDC